MRETVLFLTGVMSGASALAGCLIPVHKADTSAIEKELSDEKTRRVLAQTAADSADARVRAANLDNDRMRRQLVREREVGQGRTEFAANDEFAPWDVIPAAGVPVLTRAEWVPPK